MSAEDAHVYLRSAQSYISDREPTISPVSSVPPGDTQQRRVQTVPEPVPYKPSDAQFYVRDPTGRQRPNDEFMKSHFLREGRLTEEQALFVLAQATDVLSAERNLLRVKGAVNVCGDIHGQYYDLMKLFEIGGSLTDHCYLFLGDYVDRGCFGIECLLYLYALKINYPDRIFLLRGNHECRQLTEYFTFKRECLHKYSQAVYNACTHSFQALPLAALMDDRFFCVHGGISPELQTLDDLERVHRFEEPASHGLLCDLLWSDPIHNFGHEQDHSATGEALLPGTLWVPNQMRGCSFFYTYEAACKFLERNELLGIIRGHEAQDAGYTMHRKTPTKKFPSVITIFSAPNYLDVYNNKGAILKYANKNITIRQYHNVAHPYWLPNFMDAFTWSLPFVGSKIAEMLLAILSICSQEELLESSSSDSEGDDTQTIADLALTPNEISQRRQQIKAKILAVGRMQKVFKMLREEAENATELGMLESGAGPGPGLGIPGSSFSLGDPIGGPLGPDKLGVQGNRIGRNIRSFQEARQYDIANERMPEFDPSNVPGNGTHNIAQVIPPSMQRRGSIVSDNLIRRMLDGDDGEEDETVERLAERIARGHRLHGHGHGHGRGGAARPQPLKRHETA